MAVGFNNRQRQSLILAFCLCHAEDISTPACDTPSIEPVKG